ncbi:hypothetical protein [Enterococcus bulliens]
MMRNTVLLCVIVALVNFVGILLIGTFSIGQFIWISFLALQVYFFKNVAMNKVICLELWASFVVGLFWGQISNLIWYFFADSLSFFTLNLIDGGFLIFSLCAGALIFFQNKLPKYLPATFTGLTVTILLWGRSVPFVGQGLLGDRSLLAGIVIACFMYAYGLLLAYMMEFIYELALKRRQNKFK